MQQRNGEVHGHDQNTAIEAVAKCSSVSYLRISSASRTRLLGFDLEAAHLSSCSARLVVSSPRCMYCSTLSLKM